MYINDYQKSRTKELAFEKHLQVKYSCLTETTDPNSSHSDWDVSTTASTRHNSKITTFEVKLNSNYKTNEVCIETCRFVDGKRYDAGLSASKADYYTLCFEGDENYYIIKTDKLRELTSNHKNKYKRITYDQAGYQLNWFHKPYLLAFTKAI